MADGNPIRFPEVDHAQSPSDRCLTRSLADHPRLRGALVETAEADTGEAAMWEAVKRLIKAGKLQAGHALKIERL
jgi:hypothetical protein